MHDPVLCGVIEYLRVPMRAKTLPSGWFSAPTDVGHSAGDMQII